MAMPGHQSLRIARIGKVEPLSYGRFNALGAKRYCVVFRSIMRPRSLRITHRWNPCILIKIPERFQFQTPYSFEYGSMGETALSQVCPAIAFFQSLG